MRQRVALLGLSGAGKSTLIRRLGERLPIIHLQASALIKAEQAFRAQHPDDSESLRLGPVVDNQALMIAAFQRAAAKADRPIVFDGHSVIDGREGLVEIHSSVFVQLELDAVFYLSVDPHVIAKRRLADARRGRPTRDRDTLAKHQLIAHDAALRIAEEIGCAFICLGDGDVDRMVEAMI